MSCFFFLQNLIKLYLIERQRRAACSTGEDAAAGDARWGQLTRTGEKWGLWSRQIAAEGIQGFGTRWDQILRLQLQRMFEKLIVD